MTRCNHRHITPHTQHEPTFARRQRQQSLYAGAVRGSFENLPEIGPLSLLMSPEYRLSGGGERVRCLHGSLPDRNFIKTSPTQSDANRLPPAWPASSSILAFVARTESRRRRKIVKWLCTGYTAAECTAGTASMPNAFSKCTMRQYLYMELHVIINAIIACIHGMIDVLGRRDTAAPHSNAFLAQYSFGKRKQTVNACAFCAGHTSSSVYVCVRVYVFA